MKTEQEKSVYIQPLCEGIRIQAEQMIAASGRTEPLIEEDYVW